MDFRGWLSIDEKFSLLGKEFADDDVTVALQHVLDTHPDPKSLVVTFTEVDKVGVNPKSVFSTTPNGIYFYPLEYVLTSGISEVEFAGDRPFIKVCEIRRPERFLRMVEGASEGIGALYDRLPRAEVDEAAKIITPGDRSFDRSNYAALWLVARRVARNRVSGMEFPDRPERGATPALGTPPSGRSPKVMAEMIEWNAVFREIGVDGFVDEGTGTIYQWEPTQGVAFSAGALRVVHSIENPHSMQSGVRYDRRGMPFMPYRERKARGFNSRNYINLPHSKMAKGPNAAENIKSWIRSRKKLDVCGLIYALATSGNEVVSPEEVLGAVVSRGWPLSDQEVGNIMRCGKVDQAAFMRMLGKEGVRRFMSTHLAREALRTPEARAAADEAMA